MKIIQKLVLVLMTSIGVMPLDLQAAAAGRRFLNNAFHAAKPAVANSLFCWTRKQLQEKRQYLHVANSHTQRHDVKGTDASDKWKATAEEFKSERNLSVMALSARADEISNTAAVTICSLAIVSFFYIEYNKRKQEDLTKYNNRQTLMSEKTQLLFDDLQKKFPDSCIMWVGDKMEHLSNLYCDRNQEIKSIIVLVDSCGGDFERITKTEEFVKTVKREHLNLPCVAYSSEKAFSGGYKVASCCDKILINSEANIGSIGLLAEENFFSYLIRNLLTKEEMKCNYGYFITTAFSATIRWGKYKAPLGCGVIDHEEVRKRAELLSDYWKRNKINEILNFEQEVYNSFVNDIRNARVNKDRKLP